MYLYFENVKIQRSLLFETTDEAWSSYIWKTGGVWHCLFGLVSHGRYCYSFLFIWKKTLQKNFFAAHKVSLIKCRHAWLLCGYEWNEMIILRLKQALFIPHLVKKEHSTWNNSTHTYIAYYYPNISNILLHHREKTEILEFSYKIRRGKKFTTASPNVFCAEKIVTECETGKNDERFLPKEYNSCRTETQEGILTHTQIFL